MPILQIMGISLTDPEGEKELIANLKKAVASIPELAIPASDVSPFLVQTHVDPGDTDTIVVNVIGLIWTRKRTKKVLVATAQKIISAVQNWMNQRPKLFQKTVLIEVLIQPFNSPQPGGACYCGAEWHRP